VSQKKNPTLTMQRLKSCSASLPNNQISGRGSRRALSAVGGAARVTHLLGCTSESKLHWCHEPHNSALILSRSEKTLL
jgi:hypothetical protein